MNAMFLVAAREFRQICTTRSFWITLMLLPMALVLSQVSARMLQPPPGVAIVTVDENGRYAPMIQRRFALDRDRYVLGELGVYAQKWKIQSSSPGDVWASGPHLFTSDEVAAFDAAGGLKTAQSSLRA